MKRINLFKKVGAFLLAFMLVLSSTGVVSAATQWKWGFRTEGTGKGTISCDGTEYSGDEFLDEGMHNFEILAEEGSELTKLVKFAVDSSTGNVSYEDLTEKVTKDGKLEWGVFYEGGLIATFDEIKEETPVAPKEISRWSLRTEGEGEISCEKLGFSGGDQDVAWGEYTFKITANEGYTFGKLYLLDKDGNVADDVTEYVKDGEVQWTINYSGGLKAVFVKDETPVETPEESNTYRWALRSDENGYITCYDGDLGDHTFAKGEEVEFEIVANEGYEFDKLYSIDENGDLHEETNHVKDNKVTWTIAYNGGLLVTFKEIRHHEGWRWTLLSDGNGTIACKEVGYDAGDEFLADGYYHFEIKANEGYEFDKLFLIVNGNETDVTEYVVDGTDVEWNVTYDGALKVTFVKVEEETPVEPEEPTPFYGWRWGLLNDGNGTIGCTELGFDGGEEFVQEGTYTFEIKANEGYKFDKLYLVVDENETDVTEYVVDGASVEWKVAYDGALKATFVKVEEETPVEPTPFYGWRWGLLSDGNGTIGCTELGFDGGEEFVQEGTYTFEIKANEGYKFDKLYLVVDGNETDVTEYVVDGASVEWRVAYDGALKATFVKVEEETPVDPENPETPATPADPEEPAKPAEKNETPADATKTGDATAFLPFVAVMMVSVAGAAIVLKKRYHA